MAASKTKVFASFDFDRDRALRVLFIGQSKLPASPFEVVDYSLKEAAPEATWEKKARERIERADVLVVLLGPKTRRAPGVRKEVAMAKAAGLRRIQLMGYDYGSRDWAVEGGGRGYRWTWRNLEHLLAPPKRSFAQWFLGE